MGIVEAAKQALTQKDFKRLDDLWTEMVLDETVPLDDFFAITTELKKSHESKHAFMLLEMLATHLETNKEYRKAIDVYKNMIYHVKDNTKIRVKLARLYKDAYAKSEHLNAYIEISGLRSNEPIFKTLEKLDEFLKYDRGRFFYFERYGVGEVVDVLPSKKEIVVDFEKKKRHFLTINVARGLLTPIDETHFLYMKHKDTVALKEMVEKDPVGLINLILKSFKEPLTASHIKKHLQGIVQKENVNRFWEKVRKKLEKDKNISVSGKTAKTYAYTESEYDKAETEIAAFNRAPEKEQYTRAEEYAKKMPDVFEKILPTLIETGNRIYKKEPALALDILMLCEDLHVGATFSYTIDKILEQEIFEHIIVRLHNLEHQRRLLKMIKEKNPREWQDIAKKLVFKVTDGKLLDAIEEELKYIPDKLKDIYYTIFSLPKHYPQQFQWILKKIQSGSLQEYLSISFIPKLIESLNYVKGIKAIIYKILSLKNFDRLIKDAADSDAKRIVETINSSTILEDYKKKDFLKVIEYHFPHLFVKESNVIYTTEAALKRKKEELERIMDIEIPENKKEISRAREYGDLSENYEYKAAKERQDQLYQKVRIIESELANAQIIDPAKVSTNQVDIGTKITLKNLQDGELTHYTILGRWDTDLERNIISNEAPIAHSLLNKVHGDQVMIDGIEYQIIEIEKGL